MKRVFFLDEYEYMEFYVPGEMPKDRDYLKLNANESSYPPSPKVLEAMNTAEVKSMAHYSDPHCKELKKRGILVRHYGDTRINEYLRITIGTEEDP